MLLLIQKIIDSILQLHLAKLCLWPHGHHADSVRYKHKYSVSPHAGRPTFKISSAHAFHISGTKIHQNLSENTYMSHF